MPQCRSPLICVANLQKGRLQIRSGLLLRWKHCFVRSKNHTSRLGHCSRRRLMARGIACESTYPRGASAIQAVWKSTLAETRTPPATIAREASVTPGARRRWKDSIPIRRPGLAPFRRTLLTLEWRFSLMAPSVGIAGFGVASRSQKVVHPCTRQGLSLIHI